MTEAKATQPIGHAQHAVMDRRNDEDVFGASIQSCLHLPSPSPKSAALALKEVRAILDAERSNWRPGDPQFEIWSHFERVMIPTPLDHPGVTQLAEVVAQAADCQLRSDHDGSSFFGPGESPYVAAYALGMLKLQMQKARELRCAISGSDSSESADMDLFNKNWVSAVKSDLFSVPATNPS